MAEATAIKERQILMNSEMVRAVLEDRKTNTRRIVKNADHYSCLTGDCPHDTQAECDFYMVSRCKFGWPGERLWVRETWTPIPEMKPAGYFSDPKWIHRTAWYAADHDKPMWGGKWRPSIHMPRWASRITLEITGVRVERLQEISEEDAIAEGVSLKDPIDKSLALTAASLGMKAPIYAFAMLWERINGAGSWAANPWVWVIEFRRL